MNKVRGRSAARVVSPRKFLGSGRPPWVRQLVVAAGDSITRGQVSFDWVGKLQDDYQNAGVQFVNAGVNGNLASNLLARLDEVISCDPDVVTILIGTNDVQSTFSVKMEALFRSQQGIVAAPTREEYAQTVDDIVLRLQRESRARVVLLEIPPIGEIESEAINVTVRSYNEELRKIAQAREIQILPVYELIAGLWPQLHDPPKYSAKTSVIVKASLSHSILKRSWDDISMRNGLIALTDHIHLNSRAGRAVADCVGTGIDPGRAGG